MKRNYNVDYLRACAIVVIVVYHCYAIAGGPWQAHQILHIIMSFGGELGVTLFFVLSGFGIFWSLYFKEQNNKMPVWRCFMKQRCIRIMPQYYASIVVLLIFQLSGLISVSGIKHILAYATFTQNLFIETHGSINGALWTMATIFQYYLIAIFLYRLVRKNCIFSAVISILISITGKFLVYHYLIPDFQLGDYAYFVYGRQVLTALDNFVLGMVAANLVIRLLEKEISRKITILGGLFTLGILVILPIISYILCLKGIYADNITGYTAHSVLAFLMASLIVSVSVLPQRQYSVLRPLKFVAKYQYGIYLWHLPIIRNLYNSSSLFQSLISQSFILFTLGILVIVIIIGYYSSIWINVKNK